MPKINKNKHYTPSDLIRFLESPFATWMDRFAIEFPHLAATKDQQDTLAKTLQERGLMHELQIEESFKKKGLSYVKINTRDPNATLLAMKQGIDVIAQAPLKVNDFMGIADFLIKVEGQSQLGNFHYEVWDSKLSKNLKTTHIIQLCCYAEMLEAIQEIFPENITVVLGSGEIKKLKTNDYFDYYLRLKETFLFTQRNFNPENMPDPADFKNWANWSTYAEQLLTEKDHLFQVANITRGQIKKLNKLEIYTTKQLVETGIEHAPGLKSSIFLRLKKQATIQRLSKGKSKPLYEVFMPEELEKQGLALLPPSSSFDVFFDIEGFPLHENGLEYLWGCTYFNESGQRDFKDFWAHNRDEEKEAFQSFIRWVYDRWLKDPTMHIYHYANYEIAVCRKLMGRFGVCEEEIDQLLRNEVFVDLYKIVKGSILLGEPRYSIKNIERLYREKRKTAVGSGDDSVVAYEKWRELNALGTEGRAWQESTILKNIRDYNIDDCESTQELVEWLRARQKEYRINYLGKTEVTLQDIQQEITDRTQLRDRLLLKAKEQSATNPKLAQLTENLAWVLEFHRREAKPVFWRFFDRHGLNHDELIDDPDCLAYCQRTSREAFKVTAKARNLAYEYRFDPDQEFKGTTNDFSILGEENEEGKRINVKLIPEESNLEKGLIVLQSKEEPKAVISLVANEFVNPSPIPEMIYQVVSDYESGKLHNSAIIDFLMRSKPTIRGHSDGPIVSSNNSDESRLEQIIHVIGNLENSYLTIQGPPGAGKTYTAKHVIARLLRNGFKIGISSNSHKAIHNLLLSIAKYCNENNIKAQFVCTKETENTPTDEKIIVTANNNLVNFVQPGCVLGTTAWGFAREDMINKLDYLFIDEAGQVSLANLVAMSPCAKNLVLMGDQMQLGQPMQGTHPAESGLSILDFLLHDSPTISEDMGVFLQTTYRMHSKLNAFVSKYIYDDKLKSHPDTDKRIIHIPKDYQGKLNKEAGILFIPIQHEGNTYASDEEVEEIKRLTQELLGRTLTTLDGNARKISWSDLLFVAPYNYQTRKLKEALGDQAKVGSVDKFQGLEAPIVILSMCTSDPNESPRGLDFLLNKNRLNVAISRAQVLAIIVGSPNLENTSVNNVEQIKLVNLFAALSSYSQRN